MSSNEGVRSLYLDEDMLDSNSTMLGLGNLSTYSLKTLSHACILYVPPRKLRDLHEEKKSYV